MPNELRRTDAGKCAVALCGNCSGRRSSRKALNPTKSSLMTQTKDETDRAHRAAHWAEHRKHLVAVDQKSQEDFDKTVLSLSGGALGISFVFLKDVIGPNPIQSPELLFAAWVAWGASTFCVLVSYYLSHLAIRAAIRQIDQDTLHKKESDGNYSTCTAVLNVAGAVLFLIGVVTITLFANSNLKTKGSLNVPTQISNNSTTASTAAAPASTASRASPAASR